MNLQKQLIERMETIQKETRLEKEVRLMREELYTSGQTEKFWKHFEIVQVLKKLQK